MFTGIIETLGEVASLQAEGDNLHIEIKSELLPQLSVDQSISHNGVCLTVVALKQGSYVVTAIKETLGKTNLGAISVGDSVNLERAMNLGDRLDGHIVQGHVDQIAACIQIEESNGSWYFSFGYDSKFDNVTIVRP